MVKIRLMRIGSKGRPFYRVVAVDERKKRTGQYIEALGTYNPLTEPKEIILKSDRIEWWTKNGAVLSDGYLRITKQAPQKPPRKPKKEKAVKEPAVVKEKEAEEAEAEETAPETEAAEAAPTDETVVTEETATNEEAAIATEEPQTAEETETVEVPAEDTAKTPATDTSEEQPAK